MKAKRTLFHMTLAACVLGLSALGSQKNPVERPMKAMGQFQVVINTDPQSAEHLSYVATGVGHNTHGGRFISSLEGKVAIGPNGIITPISGEGTITMANGDQLFVELELDASGTVNVITGGTGRFVGASGSTISTDIGDPVVTPGPGTLIIDVTQEIEGSLTY